MVKKFNSSQTKYRIDGSFQGDYFQALAKIRAAITTKTAPAIFHVIGEAMPDLWQGGMFENLEPYVKATGVKSDDFVQGLSQHGYFDYYGQSVPLFAIPFNRSMPVMYYNKDLLDAKGVKVPTSWDELRDAATKLTVREGNDVKTWGFEVPVDWWFWHGLLYQAGGSSSRQTASTPASGRKGKPCGLGGHGQQAQDHEAPGWQGLQCLGGDQHRLHQPEGGHDLHLHRLRELPDREREVQDGHGLPAQEGKFAAPTGGTSRHDQDPAGTGGRLGLHQMDVRAGPGRLLVAEHRLHLHERARHRRCGDAKFTRKPQLPGGVRAVEVCAEDVHARLDPDQQVIQPNLEAPVIGLRLLTKPPRRKGGQRYSGRK
jgi:hypothetical protein